MYTVITKGNKVGTYHSPGVSDRDDMILIDSNGEVIVKQGNPITWPTDATDGLQAIVDVKAGTLRFAYDGWPRAQTEFVVSEYVEQVASAPHIFDLIDNWPQQHRECLGTMPLPEGWEWKWFGDDWVLSNGIIGLVRDDWFKYRNKMVEDQQAKPFVSVEDRSATREEVMTLVETWPIHLERNGEKITEDWVWGGLNGVTVIVNQISGKTITESDWRNYLVETLRKNQPVIGTKHDQGKPILGAVPPHAELAVGRVLTFGAEKYARGNWDKVEDHENRYMDAALRHLNAHRRGELTDSESGESHLAHAACCILFMLDKLERGNK